MEQAKRTTYETMERHLQTILITIITGSIVFAANYFFTDKESKAILLTNLSNLTAQVSEVRAELRVMREQQAKQTHVDEIERRVRELERVTASQRKN